MEFIGCVERECAKKAYLFGVINIIPHNLVLLYGFMPLQFVILCCPYTQCVYFPFNGNI